MRYASRANGQKKVQSNAGSPMRAEYKVNRTKEGSITVEKNGETDIYEQIQEQYEETKIENVIARAQLGDMSGFRNTKGEFIDITDIPTDLHSIINTVREANAKLEELRTEQPAVEQPAIEQEAANED